MTRLSPTLYPAPIEQAQTPAGRTKAALAHGTQASSCRGEFDASTSENCNDHASEALSQSQRVEGSPSNTGIPTIGGGVRLARAPETHVPVRHSGKDTHKEGCAWDIAEGDDLFARCAGTNSAESAEGRLLGSHGVEVPNTIPQAFERLNARQIAQDEVHDAYDLSALPPVWLMVLAAFVCLFTLLVADIAYSSFFTWFTGMPL